MRAVTKISYFTFDLEIWVAVINRVTGAAGRFSLATTNG